VVKSRRIKCAGHEWGIYGEEAVVGRPEGRKPLRRHRHKREYNIKVRLEELGLGAGTFLILLRIERGGGLL
jgi:hypothetical protein